MGGLAECTTKQESVTRSTVVAGPDRELTMIDNEEMVVEKERDGAVDLAIYIATKLQGLPVIADLGRGALVS